MAFALRLSQPAAPQVRALAHAEIEKARALLARPEAIDEAIHDARRAIRRTRALVALALPDRASPARRAIEDPLRGAGRALSKLRDAHSSLEVLDWLEREEPSFAGPTLRHTIRLALRRAHVRAMRGAAPLLRACDDALQAALACGFPPDDAPIDPVRGLADAYRRARRRCRDAGGGAEEDVHRFRRRVRTYYWQLELMRELRPALLAAESADVRAIAQRLGRARDIDLLAGRIARRRDANLPPVRRAIARLRERSALLQGEAMAAARIVFAEPAREMSRRWRRWDAARRTSDDAGNAAGAAAERGPVPLQLLQKAMKHAPG